MAWFIGSAKRVHGDCEPRSVAADFKASHAVGGSWAGEVPAARLPKE